MMYVIQNITVEKTFIISSGVHSAVKNVASCNR